MYCPRCAAQNLDGAKFCRGCGTDLETVALALADKLVPVEQGREKADVAKAANVSFKKRKSGVRNTVQGGILLGTALSIGIALGLFSNQPHWISIWTVFFGWMACWGAISLAFGVGAILESRMMSRQKEQTDSRIAAQTARLLRADDPGYSQAISPLSVTEHTTEPLRKQDAKSLEAS
ncbi:MAG: zinc ribbon domain-containing protein [Acidobacteriota bacterium]